MDNKQKLEVHSVYNIMKYWENKYLKNCISNVGAGGGAKNTIGKRDLWCWSLLSIDGRELILIKNEFFKISFKWSKGRTIFNFYI